MLLNKILWLIQYIQTYGMLLNKTLCSFNIYRHEVYYQKMCYLLLRCRPNSSPVSLLITSLRPRVSLFRISPKMSPSNTG